MSIRYCLVLPLLLSLLAGAAQAGTLSDAADIGDFRRAWTVHTPPGYQPGQALPLVIVYHGSGDTGAGIEQRIGLDRLADKLGFITVYPDGIDNVWAGDTADAADAAGVDDVAFTATLLDRIETQYTIDKQHVVAVGFSNGAHMVHLLACRLADRITAIVPIGGTLSGHAECHPTRPVSVVEFHDAKDPVNSYQGGRIGIHGAGSALPVSNGIWGWAVRDKCKTPAFEAKFPAAGDPVIFYVDDFVACAGGAHVRLYTTYKGVHAWPQTPDATALIGKLATGQFQ